MSLQADPQSNAEVDYVDADTGEVLTTLPFHDPGLDPIPGVPLLLSYGCGRPRRTPPYRSQPTTNPSSLNDAASLRGGV